jgi:hypothetical protein
MMFAKQQRIKKAAIYSLALLLCASGNAQGIGQSIQAGFEQYAKKDFQEKIFAHTDKNFYLAGEILWFKLYNTDASSHKPVDLSKVAYVELLDKQQKPVLQAKIALVKGEGDGSFYLPVTALSGNYTLRAYTNWMKNMGADYFFEKNITLVNSQKTWEPAAAKKTAYDIQLFPEGGNLVTNIQSKIACKVTSDEGRGAAYRGAVIDEKNDTVARFNSLHAGISSFDFTPAANHTYKAVISIAGENAMVKNLPAVYTDGYVMRVSNTNDNKIKIDVYSNLPGEVYLVAHTRKLIKLSVNAGLQNGHAVFEVDKNKLDDGISHFTIFNNKKQPVCERLYFTYPKQNLQITVKSDATEYTNRKKVNLTIQSASQQSTKQTASMSMAIYRLDSLQQIDETHIDQYLLLNADLKGAIESPAWYFTATDTKTVEAMDNLMLTHGWRRFRWEDVLQNTTPAFTYAPEFNGHLITGKLTDIRNGKPAMDIQSYLSVPGIRTQFAPSVSDAAGKVKFEMSDMYGSSEVIVQTDQRKDSVYKIDIVNPFFEKYTSRILPAVSLPRANSLLMHSVGMQVQNIYTGNKLKQFIPPPVDTIAFYLKPDSRYFLDNYTRFTTLEEVLREYVTLLDVVRENGKFHLPLLEAAAQGFFTEDPLVLLDGVPVFDIDRFMKYDPRKIRKMEMVNRRYLYRGARFDGILNWTTYDGNLPGFELDPRATVVEYEGLQLEREFYSPVYDTDAKMNSHLPDFRNLLQWVPSIRTNENGSQTISFYTSDLKGKYAVVVEGLAADGKSGNAIYRFEVK